MPTSVSKASPPDGGKGRPTLSLALGPFASDGTAFHELSYEGEKLAEIRSEGTRAFWNLRSQPSMFVVRALYRVVGSPRFVVHAVLYSKRDRRPKLAHVEAYPEWSGVVERHPDLAISVEEHRAIEEPAGLRPPTGRSVPSEPPRPLAGTR